MNQTKDSQDQIFNRHVQEVNRDMKTETPKKRRFRLFKNEAWSLGVMIALGVAIGLILSQFVFRPYRVVGESMSTTLHTGDRLIVNKLGKTLASLFGNDFIPKRGEIIVFQSPFNKDLLVKRVIGLPGERVVVSDGSITVYNTEFPNGFNPDENQPWEYDIPEYTSGEIDTLVDEDALFVSGDNRTPSGSSDSRNELGTVPLRNVVGDVSLRLLPLSDATFY